MRAYLITNTLIFTLVLLGHAARVVSHGLNSLSDPVFASSTVICVALLVWTLRLLRSNKTGA